MLMLHNCLQCSTPNDTDARYCKHCASPFTGSGSDLFAGAETVPARGVSDKGYLLVALLQLFNMLLFVVIPLLIDGNFSSSNSMMLYRVLSLISPILLYIILLTYTKKPTYKTVTGIIAAIVFFSNIYTMFVRFR